jgi:uridine phosphorylase
MMGELYTIKKTEGRVGVMTNFGGGSPIVAELAEEFIAMGVKKFILMTWGGALQTNLQAGDIVICNQAVRDEGTSYHYLPPGRYVQSDAQLADHLAANLHRLGSHPTIGATWTTDAPYRETLAEVQTYQAEGVKTVEMEAAGLFAVGQVRHVQTTAAVVIMDNLATLRWVVPEHLEPILHSLEILYAAAIGTLTDLAPVRP